VSSYRPIPRVVRSIDRRYGRAERISGGMWDSGEVEGVEGVDEVMVTISDEK
jgi:hypothetical protein